MFEEIIKRLEEMKCCQDDALKDPLIYRRNEHFDMAIDIAKEVAAEHNNGWIKCSEALPIQGQNVIVLYNHGNMITAYRSWDVADLCVKWYETNYEEELNHENIIMWHKMPELPEPYKEEV